MTRKHDLKRVVQHMVNAGKAYGPKSPAITRFGERLRKRRWFNRAQTALSASMITFGFVAFAWCSIVLYAALLFLNPFVLILLLPAVPWALVAFRHLED